MQTISTNLGPASASAHDLSVEVAVNNAAKIYYNWWQLGQGKRGWSELNGGGQTHDDPAVSIAGNGYIFAAIRGLDGTIQLNQGQVASPFVGWQSMGFKSPYSPALTSYGLTTVAVASNSAGHVLYNFWQLGKGGGGWNDLGSSLTNSKPAAALIGSYLFVVIKGRDGQLYLNQGDLGKPFVGWHRLGFSTIAAPAATSADNRAVVLGTGANGHISYQWWSLGGGGTAWKELDGGGKWGSAPSASLATNSYLFVAVKGANDPGLYLNQGQLGNPFVGWQKQ
jgi:hypothetical protein